MSILALHGFTGRGADFRGLSRLCCSEVEWQHPDLPGHGLSPSLSCTPAALANFIRNQRLEKPRIALGYSMGYQMIVNKATGFSWEAHLCGGLAGIYIAIRHEKRHERELREWNESEKNSSPEES